MHCIHLLYCLIYCIDPEQKDEQNETVEVSCNCRTRCHSRKKCPCKAKKRSCSVLCHPERSCTNLPTFPNELVTPVTLNDTEELPDVEGWTQFGSVELTSHHKRTLKSKHQWLDDSIITASQSILKQQFPEVNGLQPPILGESFSMEPQPNGFVQIVCIRGNHWICLSSTRCQPSTVYVYDSLHGKLDAHTKKVVADLMQSKADQIEIRYADVQRQSGGSDCGLFALAFATTLCFGENPETISYTQSAMREHLLSCIEKGQLLKFPQRARRRPKPALIDHFPIFCVCRLGYNGEEMVECSTCQNWYHVACVHVPLNLLQNKELPWSCAACDAS